VKLHAAHALLPEGWASDVLVEIADGRVTAVDKWGQTPLNLITHAAPASAELSSMESDPIHISGFVVPGMANVHSHAFQRAMAGLTEARTSGDDSFWTWRELMYRFAARITPEQVHDVAAYLYVEMLKAGFTAVGEFHYLHHDKGGKPYADRAEMSHRVIAAADAAGISIAHLPVLYAFGGFGARPPAAGQARFVNDAEGHAALVAGLHTRYAGTPNVRIGAAFHSLRAVDPALLKATLAALAGIDDKAPIHIHIAEQQKEVQDCIAWSGERPVAWLLDHAAVDARWCLVHATHLDEHEVARLAASGAVAGLCPTTEANLGDGIFPADTYLGGANPGRIGIGSDSHIAVSVAEELRMLEYGQRLTRNRRAALATEGQPSPGARLFTETAEGGAQALGIDAGRIAPGCRADLVVLDPDHPALWNKSSAQALDAWIFAGDSGCVRHVMVGGEWRVRDRIHPREGEIARRFRAAQAALIG
jgi:formimidoylglutamate deiminase